MIDSLKKEQEICIVGCMADTPLFVEERAVGPNKCSIRKYNSIDLTKLIMAVVVVAIHTRPLYGCEIAVLKELYGSIAQWAVPFFFLSCGYLLSKKIEGIALEEQKIGVLQNHLKKTIKLYLVWTAIYLPLTIYGYAVTHGSIKTAIIEFLIKVSLVGENYNSWMLWYLLSTIYALLFVILLRKMRIHMVVIAVLGGALFLIWPVIARLEWLTAKAPRFISSSCSMIINAIADGRIFKGMLYIPLGMLLGKGKDRPFLGATLLICGCVGYFAFGNFDQTVFDVASSTGLFVLITCLRLGDSPVYRVFREISTIVYLIHMYVWTGYYSLVYQQKTFGVDSFVVVTLISIAISLLYINIRSRRKNEKGRLYSRP